MTGTRKRLTNAQRTRILSMYLDGETVTSISQKMGVTRLTVWRWSREKVRVRYVRIEGEKK